jgi:hypothetical protein
MRIIIQGKILGSDYVETVLRLAAQDIEWLGGFGRGGGFHTVHRPGASWSIIKG